MDELAFWPVQCLPVYEALRDALLEDAPETVFQVSKTQISFRHRVMYGCASLPRRKGDRERGAVLVTFGLPEQVVDVRIMQAVEVRPRRWTHHVLVSGVEEVDPQLMAWLREAYDFGG